MLLPREGCEVNQKRVYRSFRELGIQLHNKSPKRAARAELRSDRSVAAGPQEIWAMDLYMNS